MKILAVDTTTRIGSLAFVDGEQLIAEVDMPLEITHTERLLPSIDLLLKKVGCKLSDLEGLAVSIGPGSFTGLRIGLITMKGFSQAHNIPLVGVSSLAALAHNACLNQGPVASILDAKRGEVFGAVYEFQEGHIKKVLQEECCKKPQDFCDSLKSLKSCWLVGDGALTYEKMFREALRDKAGEKAFFPPMPLMRLHAKWIAWLALPRLQKGEGKEGLGLTPNYLRPSDAEIKKEV